MIEVNTPNENFVIPREMILKLYKSEDDEYYIDIAGYKNMKKIYKDEYMRLKAILTKGE